MAGMSFAMPRKPSWIGWKRSGQGPNPCPPINVLFSINVGVDDLGHFAAGGLGVSHRRGFDQRRALPALPGGAAFMQALAVMPETIKAYFRPSRYTQLSIC